ncbi:hypothetical protein FHR90_000904 [Endobacter medicaginis]|jgi:hypothetical protein|uniref:Uncharacterized protein n=1 Tax=Endobacter medicaginis TaxID=1181271 RepID=A0A839UTH9_9PROT|nr:hypothetical protein [Endobacter medicaginis]MBB3173086.1 hypothetical protein [Endobacter medicaginis]MCX5474489.1 hypothetical protein [Endobacter medicaginis]NVN31441.1 hypothetical protein [Endobacter medicaginis]
MVGFMSVGSVAITDLTKAMVTAAAEPAPGVATFEAAIASVNDPIHPQAGLRLLTDASGHALTIATASGVTAAAFIDGHDNLIVTYQGTTSDAQMALDEQIAAGNGNAAGLADAVSFYRRAVSAAHAAGLSTFHAAYVTGHSLGGSLASYVAAQTGAGGMAFASTGVIGYHAGSTPAANFTTWLERGDPWAQFGTDTAEASVVARNGVAMDHYGTVIELGSTADQSGINAIVSAAGSLSPAQILGALAGGGTAAQQAQAQALMSRFDDALGRYHPLGGYEGAIAALPAATGAFAATSLSAIATSALSALPRLVNELPGLLHAGSVASAETMFARDFPDLAGELVRLTHAASLGAAVDLMGALVSAPLPYAGAGAKVAYVVEQMVQAGLSVHSVPTATASLATQHMMAALVHG